jgi:hypothetical protein
MGALTVGRCRSTTPIWVRRAVRCVRWARFCAKTASTRCRGASKAPKTRSCSLYVRAPRSGQLRVEVWVLIGVVHAVPFVARFDCRWYVGRLHQSVECGRCDQVSGARSVCMHACKRAMQLTTDVVVGRGRVLGWVGLVTGALRDDGRWAMGDGRWVEQEVAGRVGGAHGAAQRPGVRHRVPPEADEPAGLRRQRRRGAGVGLGGAHQTAELATGRANH